jgi:hypothetical protein
MLQTYRRRCEPSGGRPARPVPSHPLARGAGRAPGAPAHLLPDLPLAPLPSFSKIFLYIGQDRTGETGYCSEAPSADTPVRVASHIPLAPCPIAPWDGHPLAPWPIRPIPPAISARIWHPLLHLSSAFSIYSPRGVASLSPGPEIPASRLQHPGKHRPASLFSIRTRTAASARPRRDAS